MTQPRKTLIIGGSLCGLMAANLLRNDGWEVDVFERADEELAGRGAGIVTHPELLETLARCGVRVDQHIGVEVRTRMVLDASGRIVCRWAFPQILTSWGRLYGLLKVQFPVERYHGGFSLERVEQHGGRVVARFANGESASGDLLLGADGIRSTVRAQCLPSIAPQYAGYVAWRGLVEENAISKATHAAIFENFCFCLPPGEQMLGYPVAGADNTTLPGARRYNFVWYRPAAEHSGLVDLLTDESGRVHDMSIPPPLIRRDVIAAMRRAAETLLAPQFGEITRLMAQPFFQPIYDVESPQMTFGRVALAGDAAFVARPHVGMGVSKAAADAVALVDALHGCNDVEQALHRYQEARLASGSRVIARARHLGAYMQAQIKTHEERTMAERYRSPEMVLHETATPEAMWGGNPA